MQLTPAGSRASCNSCHHVVLIEKLFESETQQDRAEREEGRTAQLSNDHSIKAFRRMRALKVLQKRGISIMPVLSTRPH